MDSCASYHMTPYRESFPSLCSTSTYNIKVGDFSHICMKGKWDILVVGRHILNVLLVPNLSSKLLSIYQIYNTGGGRNVLFTPDDFEIHSLQEPLSIYGL